MLKKSPFLILFGLTLEAGSTVNLYKVRQTVIALEQQASYIQQAVSQKTSQLRKFLQRYTAIISNIVITIDSPDKTAQSLVFALDRLPALINEVLVFKFNAPLWLSTDKERARQQLLDGLRHAQMVLTALVKELYRPYRSEKAGAVPA